jgi:phage terminase large subunit-like protein
MARRPTPVPPPRSHADLSVSVLEQELARRKSAAATAGTVVEPPLRAIADRMPMRDFVPGAWSVLEGRRPFLPNWHIDAICDFYTAVSDGQISKLVINMPPGMAKSLLSSVIWPAWDWGPNNHPERRWLCISYGGTSEAPACRDADKNRELICSPWYQREWGGLFQLSDTQNSKTYFANNKRGYRVSTGLDGGVSGQRADMVMIDDPTKLDEDSLLAILKPAETYERSISHRAIDEGSAIVLIMQRLNADDLSGYFLRQDGWTHLRLPMFYEVDHKCRVFLDGELFFEDPRHTDGQPLHEKMTVATEKALQQSVVRPDVFVCQQQQRPQALEGGIIKHKWLKRWELFPPIIDEAIIIVDCAFKDGAKNSWVVMQLWGRREANAYLLDQRRDHYDLPGTIEALRGFVDQYPYAGAKWVEDKANGPGVVQMLRNEIPGLMMTSDDDGKFHKNVAGRNDLLCLKNFCSMSKEAKLSATAPYFAAGNVFLPPATVIDVSGKLWVPEYIHELTTFPKIKNDDQVDCTAMGVWKLLSSFTAHIDVTHLLDTGDDAPKDLWDRAYAEKPEFTYQTARPSGFVQHLSWGGATNPIDNAFRSRRG